MNLDVIAYDDLINPQQQKAHRLLEQALLQKGIVGIRGVPDFESKSRAFVDAARQFSQLADHIKKQYQPNREALQTEGYEIGAEQFQDEHGHWHTDDKKASYYAVVPDRSNNQWPTEVDLKTPYLALGDLIFQTGKLVLNVMGLNADAGLPHDTLSGFGRMLHYHKESDVTNKQSNWCGAHFDHGIFTGLMPAYYFQQDKEVAEPEEAGLYIASRDNPFEKIDANDKSILLFQVGEFGQLATHDRMVATKHLVKKAYGEIERFAFALFYVINQDIVIQSRSSLTKDARYADHQTADGRLAYGAWDQASLAQYYVR